MNSKPQYVQLNADHLIPVLGFGITAPEKVRILVLGLKFEKKVTNNKWELIRLFMSLTSCAMLAVSLGLLPHHSRAITSQERETMFCTRV
jgi:hypothetical protein